MKKSSGDLVTRKLRCKNFQVEMNRIELIRYNLESGERDQSDGDVGFRVCDLKLRFRVRVKDLKMRFRVRVKDFKTRFQLVSLNLQN